MSKRIGFDIDGVLARFNESFVKRLVDVTGRSLVPADADFPCWAWPGHYGYTREEENATWDNVIEDHTFWELLDPYPEAFVALDKLGACWEQGDDVYFITSRPGVDAKLQTENWLGAYGYFPIPTVLISSAKGLCARALKLDLYIDDRIENVQDVAITAGSGVRTCLVDRPWNQGFDHEAYGVVRVASALDVF